MADKFGQAALSGSASLSATLSSELPNHGANYAPAGRVVAKGSAAPFRLAPISARYWRLYIDAVQGGGDTFIELGELEFLNSTGDKIATTGGTVTYYDQYHNAASVFDGNYSIPWSANDGVPGWIGYTFSSAVEVYGFRLWRQGNFLGEEWVPTEYEVQYSTDGISWTRLGDQYTSPYPYDDTTPHATTHEFWFADLNDVIGGDLETPTSTLSATGAIGNAYDGDYALDEGGDPLDSPLLVPEVTLSAQATEELRLLPFPTLEAEGWTGNAGNGDLRGLTASVSATALFGKTFSGDLTVPFPSIESRYTLGEITALIASVDAEAIFSNVWSGSIRPGAPALSGEATFDTAAMTGRAQLLLPSLSASALIGIAGAGDIQIKKQLLSATGFTGKVFTGQLTAPMVTLSAGGDVVGIWTADIELPIVQVYATGEIAVSAARVFAINTKTTAVTEYTGFGFDSMVTFNGVVLGVNGDGLYAITGDSDDGTDIDAFLRTGITDFGSSQLKRVSSAFVNYRTDGEMELQVTVDNDESYCYPLDGNAIDQIHTDEVKIGRGLDGRNWQFEFRNVLGSDFELDAVEYDVTQLVRKLR